jgi:hypothetical protein
MYPGRDLVPLGDCVSYVKFIRINSEIIFNIDNIYFVNDGINVMVPVIEESVQSWIGWCYVIEIPNKFLKNCCFWDKVKKIEAIQFW